MTHEIKALARPEWARAGVGGSLRTTYLQRRLAAETNGEVCIDDLPVEAGRKPVDTPRAIGLTEMQTRIHTCRAPQGLVAGAPRAIGANRSGDALMGGIGRHRAGSGQGGHWDLRLVTILPCGSARMVRPDQR